MKFLLMITLSLTAVMGVVWAQRETIGELGVLYNAALSPDGRYMAVSHGSGVSLYSLPELDSIGDVTLMDGTPWALAFDPKGRFLACGTSTGEVLIMTIPSLKASETLTAHSGYIWSLRFSPGGEYLATGSWDGRVVLWDTADWEEVVSFSVGEKVWSTAFGSEGKTLAVGTAGGIDLYYLDGKGLKEKVRTGSDVWALAFLPSGRELVGGCADGRILSWDPMTGEIREVGAHKGPVWALDISLNYSYLLSVSLDATARLWSLPDGDPVAVLNHGGPLRFGAFLGKGFLTVTESGEVNRWDLEELLRLRPRILEVGYSSRVKVGRTQVVSVSFSDADGNVSRAVLRLVRGRKTDVWVDPGFDFPLGVYGLKRGTTFFSIALKAEVEVALKLYLVDSSGLWSTPYELHLGPQ